MDPPELPRRPGKMMGTYAFAGSGGFSQGIVCYFPMWRLECPALKKAPYLLS